MAHSNIYIRKENEKRWEEIADKSAWVNAMLDDRPPTLKVARQIETPKPAEELFDPPAKRTSDPGWSGPLHRDKKSGRL